MKRPAKYFPALLVLLTLAGCTLEQKLARNFVENGVKDDFILMQPDFIFKYNLKTYEIEGMDALSESEKDSLLLDKTIYLKQIDDSAFIQYFVTGFFDYCKKLGLHAFPQNYLDTFMADGKQAYVINIAQFTLEEYVHPYSSDEEINDEVYTIENIDLNAINYNVWLELSALNTENKRKVLFSSNSLMDELNGVLMQHIFSGETRYNYSIDTITMTQVYGFAMTFGQEVANKFYDYILNWYIDKELPYDYQYEHYYYHYDPEKHSIYPIDHNEALIELDNK